MMMTMTSCHRIYFIFDNKFRAKNYFTIEESLGENQLCSIDEEGDRMNYGAIKSEIEEKNKIISLI